MINYDSFLDQADYASWRAHFAKAIVRRGDPARHGDLKDWLALVQGLPDVKAEYINLESDTITIGQPEEVSSGNAKLIHDKLFKLSPWRKGPYSVFGTFIDCEWRSDWKWRRLQPHLRSLRAAHVLDVGCGSGYHCWRMLGAGARRVLGIDPSMRFAVQHLALQRFAQNSAFELLPIGIEDMPEDMPIFDRVFSMGVLYHRKDPAKHIEELVGLMVEGGQLILETLIVDANLSPSGIFTPQGRYAQMRNVWSITTIEKTLELMSAAGLVNAQCVDVNVTQLTEQRQTEWMKYHSLKQFLDPLDPSKTIEGHPAPTRGIFIADKPSSR